ncbi:MAG: VCBS repeat-containing protein [Myxococcales bacterium]|nr:VCBS repeat-containing protein [Myxococcales bacterium]
MRSTPLQDLAVANNGDLRIILGNGAGAFQVPKAFRIAGGEIAAGDFDADGKTDLAVASGSGLSVLFNTTNP